MSRQHVYLARIRCYLRPAFLAATASISAGKVNAIYAGAPGMRHNPANNPVPVRDIEQTSSRYWPKPLANHTALQRQHGIRIAGHTKGTTAGIHPPAHWNYVSATLNTFPRGFRNVTIFC